MKINKISNHLTSEEKETILLYDYVDKKWYMDTTIMKHYNKAKKQMWTQIKEYVYDDGTVCGGVFEASERAVTIRSTIKKQMSEEQFKNLNSDEDDEE